MNLKAIFRLFKKNRLIFSLCIFGLSAGFAVFIAVVMHYRFEHSYDKIHSNAENIYRLHPIYGTADGYISQYATSDNGYGPTLKEELPEVLDYVRMLAYQSERIVSYIPENGPVLKYREPHVFVVDSGFFSFFNYELKLGSEYDVLNKPNTIVISESAAVKYFGDEDPMGKSLNVSTNGDPFVCEITGIFYDIPDNSNLQFNFLVSFETLKQVFPGVDNSWNFGISYTYLLLAENTDIKKFEDRIMEVFFKRSGVVAAGDLIYDMELVHFPQIHLNEPIQWELEEKGSRAETNYLLSIAIVIIIISWLNYMNISTSLAIQRNKSTRIKYILGSSRSQLVMQFISEAFFVNLISICVSIFLVFLASSFIDTFFQHGGTGFIFSDPFTLLVIACILLTGTVASGVISAIFFFVNNPDFLSISNATSSGSRFRQIMVVAQFTTAVVLIIGAILVYKQVEFLRSQELGVELSQIVVIQSPGGSHASPSGLNKIRQSLASNPHFINVSAGSDIPGQFMDMGWMIDRTSINPPVHEITDGGQIDFDYVETLGLEMAAGVDFDDQMNTERKILINEEMARLLRFESPAEAVGQRVQLPEMYGDQPVTILGVIKNYRQQSPTHPIKPVFFYCREFAFLPYDYFIFRYQGKSEEVISCLNDTWAKEFPESSFDYYFLNDHYEKQYSGNIRFGKLFGILSMMAILISILGLVGLSINTAQQRVKEIGIRKINGAKVREVLIMLNKDFARWILISVVMGSISAYFIMHGWLENFAVQTTISWWIFALAGILAFGIALLTVSWQSWQAARQNPVVALRYE